MSIDQSYLSTKISYGITDDSIRVLILPDSLKIPSYLNGLMVISIYVSDAQKIDGINLHLLKIFNTDSLEVLRFNNKYLSPISIHEYPDTIQPYVKFALNYASNLKIHKTSENKQGAKYMLSVMRRLE